MIYFDENHVTLHHGDNRLILPTLEAGSVNCCVTSPPYWGLRDYGVDGQIGLEQTPEAYVAEMVAVFREVRRVLRDDGTLWVNLGDSYTSGGRKTRDPGQSKIHPAFEGESFKDGLRPATPAGLKEKDLVGIPWMVAFALRADGWYLRQDIIWSKPSPMPESVEDRCTKAHEYIFLLSKSAKYHCDMKAIAEPAVESNAARPRMGHGPNTQYEQKRASWNGSEFHTGKTAEHQLNRASKHRQAEPQANGHRLVDSVAKARADGGAHDSPFGETRNKRDVWRVEEDEWEQFQQWKRQQMKPDVWTVATQPYSEAHFATFPPKLIEPCIKAGVPAGGVVLDPFFGAGTTGLVAQQQHVRCIGIELNEKYCEIAKRRLEQGVLF